MSFKATNDLGTDFLISEDHLAQLFRVELLGKRGRAHQITKHHGQLPSFSRSQSGVRSPGSGVGKGFPFFLRLCRFSLSPFLPFSVSSLPSFFRERGGTLATKRKPRRVLEATLRAAEA